jgi:hypothetical protein
MSIWRRVLDLGHCREQVEVEGTAKGKWEAKLRCRIYDVDRSNGGWRFNGS